MYKDTFLKLRGVDNCNVEIEMPVDEARQFVHDYQLLRSAGAAERMYHAESYARLDALFDRLSRLTNMRW